MCVRKDRKVNGLVPTHVYCISSSMTVGRDFITVVAVVGAVHGSDHSRISSVSLASKTTAPAQSYGVVVVILYLAILVERRLVMDIQTDGRTQGHSI